MRAVQAYLNISNYSFCAYQQDRDVDILVWKLSVIRNKKLGFTTVLYAGLEDKGYIEFHGFDKLYDEINYIDINETNLTKVSLVHFWAAFKFVAIEKELEQPLPFFLVDTDLVFMDDTILEKIYSPVLVWANTEPISNYPPLATLPIQDTFRYPRYFKLTTRPVNTAILKVDNRDILRDWLALAWKFMIGNPLPDVGSTFGLMITAEQRFLPNVIRNKYNEEISFFCDLKINNFGKEHFHIWGAKVFINHGFKFRNSWIKSLLTLIKQEDETIYDDIIRNAPINIKYVVEHWDETNTISCLYQYFKKEEEEK